MKKTIATIAAFCLMLILSTSFALAQNGSVSTGQTSWSTEVERPILVDAGPTVDLGKIAPGTTRTFPNPEALALTFDVSGAPGVPFLMTNSVAAESEGLTLGDVTWEYFYSNTWTTLPQENKYWLSGTQGNENSGIRKFRAKPSTLTCPATVASGTEANFTVTLTATYTNY